MAEKKTLIDAITAFIADADAAYEAGDRSQLQRIWAHRNSDIRSALACLQGDAATHFSMGTLTPVKLGEVMHRAFAAGYSHARSEQKVEDLIDAVAAALGVDTGTIHEDKFAAAVDAVLGDTPGHRFVNIPIDQNDVLKAIKDQAVSRLSRLLDQAFAAGTTQGYDIGTHDAGLNSK